jgi:hypothetical protein
MQHCECFSWPVQLQIAKMLLLLLQQLLHTFT